MVVRPAFEHTLLSATASTLLMLFSVNQWEFVTDGHMETIRIDPTRMAQGIMTGIGFLGAGAIMKENLAIRGLTTAASIWMTASIGIIIGIGFYFPAAVAFLMTLGILSLFRWIEDLIPSLYFGRLSICFLRNESISAQELCEVINNHNVTCTNFSYHLEGKGKSFQYQMTIRSKKTDNFQKLAETLNKMDRVREFSIVPTGD
jgi:putative Mg2+ transporter-C (MgtC) family protein